MNVEQITRLISLSELFYGLRESLLCQLARAAVVQEVPADTVIIRREESTAGLGLLLTGELSYSALVNGLEIVALMLGPGSWIGLGALFEHRPSGSQIRTMTPSTLLWLDAKDVLRLLAEAPEDAQIVLARARAQFDERLEAINKGIEAAK
ncbi:MAG: cyclic nucleotide-binding domain-containing protein [Dehalococcoidia bacterium]|nr:cyclic nucleotide-binding domain-containing protein [Dehalococcoidia bacterium]